MFPVPHQKEKRHFQQPPLLNTIAPPPLPAGELFMSRRGVRQNPKNKDSEVWKTPSDATNRFFRVDQADVEKERRIQRREKYAERKKFLQAHQAALETARWEQATENYRRRKELEERKRAGSKLGCSSVSYSPVSVEYRRDRAGELLQKADAEAKARVAERSECLYHKANTYNPLTGEDIRPPPDLAGRSWLRRY